MKANIYEEDQRPRVPQGNEFSKPVSSKNRTRAQWLLPVGLILLSVIPLTFGIVRLAELAGGAEVTPANARFFAAPLPVVLHIVSASLYAVFGAFQFVSRLWQQGSNWHRWVGRLLVPCDLVVGLSGLWMTLFYPWPEGDGVLLYAFRLLFGWGMVMSIILGFVTIRRGNVPQHRAWMTRGYAIGLGAATQTFTLMIGEIIGGPPSETSRALLMGAAWVINLAVAEWAIRKKRRPGRTTAVTTPHS